MKASLIRQTKCFCYDFTPIRHLLKDIGATVVNKIQQEDYIYHLMDEAGQKTKRLKLRVENRVPKFIYIYCRTDNENSITYDFFEVKDIQIKRILEKILEIPVVVIKEREVWRKENFIFNLDNVEGLGLIFEIEIENENNDIHVDEVNRYKDIFAPYLGDFVHGSNEDLILQHQAKVE